MKKIFAFLWLLCVAVCVNANPRSVDEARMEARGFLVSTQSSRTNRVAANPSLSLVHTIAQKTSVAPAAYVFQSGADQGFVIVSAEDACTSILGYADHGHFDADHIPTNLQTWLKHYAEEIEWAANHPEAVASNTTMTSTMQASGRAVAPLLGNNIKWGQDAPFNNLCPIDSDNRRSVTGCVATAAAQIMRYWQYPSQGTGSHSYEWERSNGTTRSVSANFGATTYDWANMLPSYKGTYTTAQANAVATLMFHAGVACEMNYSSNGSGANSAEMCNAMHTYFGYDAALSSYNADFEGYAVLAEKIQEELEAGRPVMMGGATTLNEGHCFVCEGSDGKGKFYFNWGWTSSYDGYFQLSALQPAGQGTGGASSGHAYTVRVTAYTGIQPNQGGVSTLPKLGAKSVSIDNNLIIAQNSRVSFQIETLRNISMSAWTGCLAMAIYDSNGNYVNMIQNTTYYSLNPEYYKPTIITISGNLPSLADGQYVLKPVYSISGNQGLYPIIVQETPQEFAFTVSGNIVNLGGELLEQEAQYTIVFKDNDTNSDSGTPISSTNSNLSQFVQQSDITISSFSCSYIYLGKDNYGLKFSSSNADGFLTLNLNQEIIVDSINIVLGGYNDTERNFILQGNALTSVHKASSGFETRTVKFGGTRLSSLTFQGTQRAYVKSLTIYTTPFETPHADFDFARGNGSSYLGKNIKLYLYTDDYEADLSGNAFSGTAFVLDLGTASSKSILGTYVLTNTYTYTPGVLTKAYSYLSYGGAKYKMNSGVVTIINNQQNQYEILYDIQVEDGKTYTGTIIIPISKISIYGTWDYDAVAAWDISRTNTALANLPLNTPTIHKYLIKGIISQVDSGNPAQFYISQDGTTNQQLYCYNARYLNNAIFTGGEIAVGDTVIMCARLEYYNGTPELMGYVFKHYPYIDPNRYTPHDLATIVKPGMVYFYWVCEGGNEFDLEITEIPSNSTWVFDSKGSPDSIYFTGAPLEYAWRVRTKSPLTEWVSGENFTTVVNPYEPTNLQFTTSDDHNYQLTWEADSVAYNYEIEIFLNGKLYAQKTVTELSASFDLLNKSTYEWTVWAYDENHNALGFADGSSIKVSHSINYEAQNLTIISNGLTITAVWDSPAPLFDVRINDANKNNLYKEYLSCKHVQFTAPKTGTYEVTVRPMNAEKTFYAGALVSTTITLLGLAPSTRQYQLTLQAMDGGCIVTDTFGIYAYGTPVEIEARADSNYQFLQWSDGNTYARRSIIMTKDLTLTAYFREIGLDALPVVREDENKPIKRMINNQIVIVCGERIYNLMGEQIR